MNVTRKEQRIIQRALNARQASGELTPRTASGWRKRCASPLRLAAPEPLCLLDRAGLRADFPGQSVRRQRAGGVAAEPVQPLGADADPAACAAGSRLLRLGFSPPAAGDAVALQHRGDFVSGRRLYRGGAMAAWRTAG